MSDYRQKLKVLTEMCTLWENGKQAAVGELVQTVEADNQGNGSTSEAFVAELETEYTTVAPASALPIYFRT